MSVTPAGPDRPSQVSLVVHSCLWGALCLGAYATLIVAAVSMRPRPSSLFLVLSIVGAALSALAIGLGAGLPRIARSITVACLGLLLVANFQILLLAPSRSLATACLLGLDRMVQQSAHHMVWGYLLVFLAAVALAGAVASKTCSRSLTTRLLTSIPAGMAMILMGVGLVLLVIWMARGEGGLGDMRKTVGAVASLLVVCLAVVLGMTGMVCALAHGVTRSRDPALRTFSLLSTQLAYYLLLGNVLVAGTVVAIQAKAGMWSYVLLGVSWVPELGALFLWIVGMADVVRQALWMAGHVPSPEGGLRPHVVDDIPVARVRGVPTAPDRVPEARVIPDAVPEARVVPDHAPEARVVPDDLPEARLVSDDATEDAPDSDDAPQAPAVPDDVPAARVRTSPQHAVRPDPVAKPPSVEDRLKRLKDLHDKGLISDTEYNKRKNKMLDEL